MVLMIVVLMFVLIGGIVLEVMFVGMLLVMFDVVFVCGGDGDGCDFVYSVDVCYFVCEVFKYLKLIVVVGLGW